MEGLLFIALLILAIIVADQIITHAIGVKAAWIVFKKGHYKVAFKLLWITFISFISFKPYGKEED